jgi:hypothetical protein
MSLWNQTKGKIAVVAVLTTVFWYKANKRNMRNVRKFITDNQLEETFDKWGHFGFDIRVHADDPSPIIPMSKRKS